MATLLHSLLHVTNFPPAPSPSTPGTGSPFLSTLLPAVAASAAVQLAFGVPSIIKQTEIYYDLAGGVGYYATLATVFVVPVLRAKLAAGEGAGLSIKEVLKGLKLGKDRDWRQVVLTGANFVWAARRRSCLFLFLCG